MLINQDLMAVMRRGAWVTKSDQKKQNDAGVIVMVCIFLAGVLIVALIGHNAESVGQTGSTARWHFTKSLSIKGF